MTFCIPLSLRLRVWNELLIPAWVSWMPLSVKSGQMNGSVMQVMCLQSSRTAPHGFYSRGWSVTICNQKNTPMWEALSGGNDLTGKRWVQGRCRPPSHLLDTLQEDLGRLDGWLYQARINARAIRGYSLRPWKTSEPWLCVRKNGTATLIGNTLVSILMLALGPQISQSSPGGEHEWQAMWQDSKAVLPCH